MARNDEWSIAEPETLSFAEDPIVEAEIRVMGGAVNVVATDEPVARLEVASVDGPPLLVRIDGERLVVGYPDLPWQGFLSWLAHRRRRRQAVISLSLPRSCRVSVGAVTADVTLGGLAGAVSVDAVSGDVTLVGLAGRTGVETVSGPVEALGLRGPLRCHSVSGPLTVADGTGPAVQADTVSGDLLVDHASAAVPPDIRLGSVSGRIALRLPEGVGATVSGSTLSGTVTCSLPGLRVGPWGAKSLAGRIGSGAGTISLSSLSGSLALLRHPGIEAARPAPSTLRKDV
ncbi:hypothetical protein FH609_000820 [Streptomyces sp. 3MP-14]|uniref:DUF4097 family beta strand repeat protein n=1 Tax=Streptomyces mimosae TaxID=2586635 RepID=A0A5N6AR17_9ACTN|nr:MULTISPECIES: DUF4097 domain-containing protein [Streptomyces]KAB8171054.1 hypothetical protein FH607_001650 [Streptomyces mimosae]KAB8179594.1 hypothetical protein FH609_000820 [Streptomyces sp. 3MP-14]